MADICSSKLDVAKSLALTEGRGFGAMLEITGSEKLINESFSYLTQVSTKQIFH